MLDVEGDELRAAQRGGEPEQQQLTLDVFRTIAVEPTRDVLGKSHGRKSNGGTERAAMESSGQTPRPSAGGGVPPGGGHDYPLTFSVDYPDRSLNRISTAFRIFTIIPIAILAATVEGGSFGAQAGGAGARYAGGGIGILVIPVLLMLLFRKKYPRWWYDWNLQLTRFTNRIAVYFALMDDRYPLHRRGAGRPPQLPLSRRRARPQPGPAAGQVAARDPPLHGAVLPHDRRAARRHLRLVRDPLHRSLPTHRVRVHRGRDPLAQPRRGLCLPPDHRPLPAIQSAGLTTDLWVWTQSKAAAGRRSSAARTATVSTAGSACVSARGAC